VITAGGTLGILIPPSVMIIVYAAVAGQSVVKLYAAAMFPGFFLSFLYLVYIIGWAMINPKIAPPLPEAQTKVPVPEWVHKFAGAYSKNIMVGLLSALGSPGRALKLQTETGRLTYWRLLSSTTNALVPFMMIAGTLALTYWYVVIHQQATVQEVVTGVQQLGSRSLDSGSATPAEQGPPEGFYLWFGISCLVGIFLAVRYYWRMDAERFEVLKLLNSSIMPLGILTVVVLAVILFGITTATESAGVGAAGAFLLVWGTLIVGVADNLLRPLLIAGHSRVPTLAVFVGVLGGLAAFGLVGMFLGPLLISLVIVLVRFADASLASR